MARELDGDAGVLLERLVAALAGHGGEVACLLHERVVLHRLDGTRVEGRAAVADAIANHGTETRFRALGRASDSVRVAMEIDGVPGELRFALHGVVAEAMLFEIRMV